MKTHLYFVNFYSDSLNTSVHPSAMDLQPSSSYPPLSNFTPFTSPSPTPTSSMGEDRFLEMPAILHKQHEAIPDMNPPKYQPGDEVIMVSFEQEKRKTQKNRLVSIWIVVGGGYSDICDEKIYILEPNKFPISNVQRHENDAYVIVLEKDILKPKVKYSQLVRIWQGANVVRSGKYMVVGFKYDDAAGFTYLVQDEREGPPEECDEVDVKPLSKGYGIGQS